MAMMKHANLGMLAAAVAVAAGAALAAPDGEPGWYGGLDVGRSRLGLGGPKVDLGYRISRNFAFVGSYADFRKFRHDPAWTEPGTEPIRRGYADHAWSLTGVGTAALGEKWSLYGKAGFARSWAEHGTSSTFGAGTPALGLRPGTGFVIGAGARYEFSRRLFGKFEWDRYSRAGDADATGGGDIDRYSIRFGLRF